MPVEPFTIALAANALGSFIAACTYDELKRLDTSNQVARTTRKLDDIVEDVGQLLIDAGHSTSDPARSLPMLEAIVTVDLRRLIGLEVQAKVLGSYPALKQKFTRTLGNILPEDRSYSPEQIERAISEAIDVVMTTVEPTDLGRIAGGAKRSDREIIRLLTAIATEVQGLSRRLEPGTPPVTPAEVVTAIKISGRDRYKMIPLPDFLTVRREPVERLYVPPTLVGWETRVRTSPDRHPWETEREFILGNPGAGKSTLTKYVALRMSYGTSTPAPVTLELRSMEEEIANDMPMLDSITKACRAQSSVALTEGHVVHLIGDGKLLIVFDGLDELTEIQHRHLVLDQLASLTSAFPKAPMLLTSRLQGFDSSAVPRSFTASVIQDFSEKEIRNYAGKWFQRGEPSGIATADFMRDSDQIPDLRSNPLMLALVCLLYESSHTIPTTRAELYGRCSQLMFREWDRHRHIVIGAAFDDFLSDALDELGYQLYFGLLTSTDQLDSDEVLEPTELLDLYHARSGTSAPLDDVRSALAKFLTGWHVGHSGQAERSASAFIDFCRTRLWALTETSGSHDDQVSLGFVHKTFLEFHAASRLARTTNAAYLGRLVLDGSTDPGLSTLLEVAVQLKAKSERGFGDVLVRLALAAETAESSRVAAVRLILSSIPVRPDSIDALLKFWRAKVFASDLTLAIGWLASFCMARGSIRSQIALGLARMFRSTGAMDAAATARILDLLLSTPADVLKTATQLVRVSDSVRFIESFRALGVAVIDSGELVDWTRVGEFSPRLSAELVRRRPTPDVLASAGVSVLFADMGGSDDRSGNSMLESLLGSVFDQSVLERLENGDWSLGVMRSIADLILSDRIDDFLASGIPRSSVVTTADGLERLIHRGLGSVTVNPDDWMMANSPRIEDASLEELGLPSPEAQRIATRVGLAWLIWLADCVAESAGSTPVSGTLAEAELLDFRSLVEVAAGLPVSDLSWRETWGTSDTAIELLDRFSASVDRWRTMQVVVVK